GTGLPAIRQMESCSAPGLFFLGLDGLRNFQSRFIRGIRSDAPALAGLLQERLQNRAQSSRPIIPALVT
ncbi:MAG TPA: hypothetical protein VMZ27_09830, partial [Candidatus Saccharimonadales bacterium]|nr:hypothetical protein [Candidatus Saccharimonadales bacterium]